MVAVELLPQITHTHHALPWIIVGFVLGVIVMLGVRQLDRRAEARAGTEKAWPVGLIAGAVVDQLVSRVVLGIGIAAGQNLGALLSFSMAVENLSFGLTITTLLGSAGATRGQMVGTTAGLGLLFIIITALSEAVLGGLPAGPIALLLSFGSAALLFVVTEQLLVEAHDVRKARHLASAFFVGFLLLLVLGMLSRGSDTGTARGQAGTSGQGGQYLIVCQHVTCTRADPG